MHSCLKQKPHSPPAPLAYPKLNCLGTLPCPICKRILQLPLLPLVMWKTWLHYAQASTMNCFHAFFSKTTTYYPTSCAHLSFAFFYFIFFLLEFSSPHPTIQKLFPSSFINKLACWSNCSPPIMNFSLQREPPKYSENAHNMPSKNKTNIVW